MAIELPSGFKITSAEPSDSRITVANSGSRLGFSAANVYNGLVVYQQDTKELYVLTDAANNTVPISWQLVGSNTNTGSFVTTSSFNAFTSSYSTGSFTGSFIGTHTGSLFGTSSWAINAQTASFYAETDPIFTAKSGSFATTGSNIFKGTQTITGSLLITGSTVQIGNNTLVGNTLLSGSINMSGNILVTGSITATNQTASFGYVSASFLDITGKQTVKGYTQYLPTSDAVPIATPGGYIYASGSQGDLYFAQTNGSINNVIRLRWLEGNMYSGLLNGGLITTQSTTTYQVSSGSGIIVSLNGSLSTDPYPAVQYISWENLSANIAPLSASFDQSFVAIEPSGNTGIIHVQGIPYDDGQFNTLIPIGNVIHQNRSTINATATYPSVAYGYKQRSSDFIRAFGPLKFSGLNTIVSGSSTGSLQVTSGTSYNEGRNYVNDVNNPSYVSDSGQPISKIYRYYQSGSSWKYLTNGGAGYETIDPTQYSLNGILTAVPGTGANRNFTIQRVYYFPAGATKGIYVYYGNAIYASAVEAIANIPYEDFTEAPNTAAGAVLSAYLVVRNNANFTVADSYNIRPGGLFRNVGGAGGGGSAITQTLAGLSDVTLTSLIGGQPLVYDSTSLKWENKSTLTANLVGTSSWATDAINSNTASYVLQAVSSSFASTASFAQGGNGSFSGSFSGSGANLNSIPTIAVVGNFTQIATGSVTASVTPTQFSVVSGSMTEFLVTGTGVTLGSAIADTHRITGSLTITGSNTVIGDKTITGSLIVSSSNATQFLVGSSSLFINSAGNVGIGTTNPVGSLDIISSTTGSLRISGSGGSIITLFRPNSTLSGFVKYTRGAMDIGTANTDGLSLFTNNVQRVSIASAGDISIASAGTQTAFSISNASTPLLFVSSSGQVGIGTTAVGANFLYVSGGNILYDLGGAQTAAFTSGGGIRMSFNGNTVVWQSGTTTLLGGNASATALSTVQGSGNWGVNRGGKSGYAISTNGAVDINAAVGSNQTVLQVVSGSIPLLLVNTSGSVGIGTSTPNATLDVNGSVNISGSGVNTPFKVITAGTGLGSGSLYVTQSGVVYLINSSSESKNLVVRENSTNPTVIQLQNSNNYTGNITFTQGNTPATIANNSKGQQLQITGPGGGISIAATVSQSATSTIDFVVGGFASAAAATLAGRFTNSGRFLLNTSTDDGTNQLQVSGSARIADTTVASGSANAGSLLDLQQTWNTTGTPTAIKLNVTDTASTTSSRLLDLQINGTSKFIVDKNFGTGQSISFNGAAGTAMYMNGDRILFRTGASLYIGNTNSNVAIFANSAQAISIGATSQNNVLIGTTSDIPSAKLVVTSTTSGFLPPRMTNAQRIAITSPAVGLIVYCTDAVEGVYVNKSTGWTFIG
ncbi:hypothetical protein UFOVP54_32 [uncultured Caudovirales phage]|uniref:Uncharacterized protein n=1 Tax=uncultured Caudovirales phage TaxID=2100421 RepID=A0A6J5KV64_9CAUD|nr:hypothetical protein UFOVP54_32 [uncultured Caudovirales phage]